MRDGARAHRRHPPHVRAVRADGHLLQRHNVRRDRPDGLRLCFDTPSCYTQVRALPGDLLQRHPDGEPIRLHECALRIAALRRASLCSPLVSRPAVCADGSCVGLYGNSGTCNFAPSTFASGSLTTLAGVGFTYIENNGAALPAYDFCYDQRTSPPLPPLPPPQPPAPPPAQRCGTAPFINSNDVRLAAELGSEKMDVSDASQYLNPVNITFTGLYQPADYCKATYPACGSTCGSGCLTCVAIARQSLPRLTLEPPLPSQLRGWHVRGRVQLQAGQRSGCE